MEHSVTLMGLAIALLFVAMSPGPAFLVVLQQAVGRSRAAGVVAALGITVGSLVWIVLILLGINVVLQQAAWLYGLLRLAGATYLLYLGIRMWRGARQPITPAPASPEGGGRRGWTFGRALVLQLLNPKAAIFFSSVFLTMLPPGAPGWVIGAALVLVAVIEFGWYLVVAMTFSSPPARRVYTKAKLWIERAAGAWLAFFGVKLAVSDR